MIPQISQRTEQEKTQLPQALHGDDIAAAEDILFDFFDLFDKTIDDVHAYILHRVCSPEIAEDITLSVYFSLLQRRRFFWWRSAVTLSMILSLVDKSISASRSWEVDSMNAQYLKEFLQCVPNRQNTQTRDRVRLILDVLKGLPTKQQQIAIFRFLLHWDTEKTSEVLERDESKIEKEYEAVLRQFIQHVGEDPLFAETGVQSFFESITCAKMDKSQKATLRIALLEKYRSAQLSNMQFVMPVTALLFVATTFLGSYAVYSTKYLPPVSAQASLQQTNAVAVLLLGKELEYRDALVGAEQDIRGMAAHFAQKDLARISLELAPYAIQEQITLEKNVRRSLKKISIRALILSSVDTSQRIAMMSP